MEHRLRASQEIRLVRSTNQKQNLYFSKGVARSAVGLHCGQPLLSRFLGSPFFLKPFSILLEGRRLTQCLQLRAVGRDRRERRAGRRTGNQRTENQQSRGNGRSPMGHELLSTGQPYPFATKSRAGLFLTTTVFAHLSPKRLRSDEKTMQASTKPKNGMTRLSWRTIAAP